MSSRYDKVYLVDIENALRFALRREIGLVKQIDGEKLEVLRDFLRVLVKYLPSRPKIHDFVRNLYDKVVEYEEEIGILTRMQYRQALKEAGEVGVLPPEQPYVGCKGSQMKYRGYPCALWQLFHVLLVNAYEIENRNPSVDPLEVLQSIHDYIKHFFTCRSCSTHFQKMYTTSPTAHDYVNSPKDAIMWLWKAHNRVNVRLAGDDSEDPQFPKIIFPPRKFCRMCWKRIGKTNRYKIHHYGVFLYLKKIYSKYQVSLFGLAVIEPPVPIPVPVSPKVTNSYSKRSHHSLSKSRFSDECIEMKMILLYGSISVTVAIVFAAMKLKKRWCKRNYIVVKTNVY